MWLRMSISIFRRMEKCVKILLVEDSRLIRRENQAALMKAGYEVMCAEDGEAALQMAQELSPDLILLDMIIPKINGPEVLHELKSAPATSEIPVVIVSKREAGVCLHLRRVETRGQDQPEALILRMIIDCGTDSEQRVAGLKADANGYRNCGAANPSFLAPIIPCRDT